MRSNGIIALANRYPGGGYFLFESAHDAAQAGLDLQAAGYDVDLYPNTVYGIRQGYVVHYHPAVLGLN